METGDKGAPRHRERQRVEVVVVVVVGLMGGRELLCFRLVLVRGCEIQQLHSSIPLSSPFSRAASDRFKFTILM